MRRLQLRPGAQLACIFCLALVSRMAFLWLSGAYGQIINGDGFSYTQIAASLSAGDGFALGPDQPTAFRLFGYPWLIAAVYSLTGSTIAGVQWVQGLLGSLVVLLTYALGRRLAGPWTAALAGLIVALHPVLLYLTGLAAPDAAALACQMGLLWCAWRIAAFGKGKTAGFIASGAIGILLRPELLLAVWLFPISVMLILGLRAPRTRMLCVAAILAMLLGVLPPVVRNAAIFGEFVPFPTIGGVTFWGANNAHATGGWLMPTPENWPDADPPPLGMHGWPGLSETESQARFYRTSFQWLKNDPVDALRLLPRKLARSWTLTFADEARGRALPAAVEWLNAAFGLLALFGVAIAWQRRDRLLVTLLLVPAAAWLAKTIIFYGSARQTAAVLPVAAIFAGLTIVELAGRAKKARG